MTLDLKPANSKPRTLNPKPQTVSDNADFTMWRTFAASRLHCRADPRDPLLRSERTQRIPSTVGRGVRLCWALSKPKGPKKKPLAREITESMRHGSRKSNLRFRSVASLAAVSLGTLLILVVRLTSPGRHHQHPHNRTGARAGPRLLCRTAEDVKEALGLRLEQIRKSRVRQRIILVFSCSGSRDPRCSWNSSPRSLSRVLTSPSSIKAA